MKSKKILFAALALTLPTWTLCAQDSVQPQQTPQPPQPPNAPQGLPPGQASTPPTAQRPDGRHGGDIGNGWQRGPSIFGLLDANHDGVIDAEELKNAGEVLKKLDKRGDGKITPDEFFPQGEGRGMRRPPGDGARPGGPGQPGQPPVDANRGPNPGAQNPGAPNGGPQGPQAQWQGHHQHGPGGPNGGPQFSQNGPRGPWQPRGPQGPQQGQGFAQNGSQGLWMQHRHHHGQFGPQQGPGFAQNGPQGPWMQHRHHHGQFGPQQGQGFAQNGPQGPWMQHHHQHGQFGPQQGQGFAQRGSQFGPQPQRGPQPWAQRGPGAPEFRQFSHRPQQGGQFPQRQFNPGWMNPQPAPGGPQPENRNPAGNGPQHHHFHPPFTGNFEPGEGGAAGPQGEAAPEFQPTEPAPGDFGDNVPAPAEPGDVI